MSAKLETMANISSPPLGLLWARQACKPPMEGSWVDFESELPLHPP